MLARRDRLSPVSTAGASAVEDSGSTGAFAGAAFLEAFFFAGVAFFLEDFFFEAAFFLEDFFFTAPAPSSMVPKGRVCESLVVSLAKRSSRAGGAGAGRPEAAGWVPRTRDQPIPRMLEGYR